MPDSFCPAAALISSAVLPFVIPTGAEGSAVQRTRTGNVFRPNTTNEMFSNERRNTVAFELETTANGDARDKETLYMLGGLSMIVFGAGLIL